MTQELFNQQYLNFQYWILFVEVLTVIAASAFAFLQYRINNRLKKLQDYVAVNIVPLATPLSLQVINVGKINVYLQKYEIGSNKESFAKPMLIPSGSNSFLLLPIKAYNVGLKMDVTLCLIDELGEKFISTGEVVVEQIQIQQKIQQSADSTSPSSQTINALQPSAWAYKTIKKNWEL